MRFLPHFLLRALVLRSTVIAPFFFLLTVASTLLVGSLQQIGFSNPDLLPGAFDQPPAQQLALLIDYGAPFSFSIIFILLSHEMGHYLTARYYRVDATLPYFIPFPMSFIGTLGAFIIIRSPFPHRRSLIDVGLAGPFAGFLATLPVLYLGIAGSRPSLPLAGDSITFGEPLLFRLVSSLMWPDLPEGYVFYVSPIGLAAWFGLILTAFNLLPIGQLDGGHASYAIFRERAHRISRYVFYGMILMSVVTPAWLFWAALIYLLGIRRAHPPTLDDGAPLTTSRKVMGILALVIFVLCFTPEPIETSWTEFLAAFGLL